VKSAATATVSEFGLVITDSSPERGPHPIELPQAQGIFTIAIRVAVDPWGLLAILYLLIFGSIVGYVCFIYALNELPSSTVSLYAYINPVIEVVLGKIVFDERLDWAIAAGTPIIFSGILLVQTAPGR
jgi:drug/metabolite transporter (DMT)-like permease